MFIDNYPYNMYDISQQTRWINTTDLYMYFENNQFHEGQLFGEQD